MISEIFTGRDGAYAAALDSPSDVTNAAACDGVGFIARVPTSTANEALESNIAAPSPPTASGAISPAPDIRERLISGTCNQSATPSLISWQATLHPFNGFEVLC